MRVYFADPLFDVGLWTTKVCTNLAQAYEARPKKARFGANLLTYNGLEHLPDNDICPNRLLGIKLANKSARQSAIAIFDLATKLGLYWLLQQRVSPYICTWTWYEQGEPFPVNGVRCERIQSTKYDKKGSYTSIELFTERVKQGYILPKVGTHSCTIDLARDRSRLHFGLFRKD